MFAFLRSVRAKYHGDGKVGWLDGERKRDEIEITERTN